MTDKKRIEENAEQKNIQMLEGHVKENIQKYDEYKIKREEIKHEHIKARAMSNSKEDESWSIPFKNANIEMYFDDSSKKWNAELKLRNEETIEFSFNASENDLSDFWYGFNYNGKEYDMNICNGGDYGNGGWIYPVDNEGHVDTSISEQLDSVNIYSRNRNNIQFWTWKDYDDLSGHLVAPDGKSYFSYDWTTKEYKVTPDSGWDSFLDADPTRDTSLTAFKEYAQKFVKENIVRDSDIKIIFEREYIDTEKLLEEEEKEMAKSETLADKYNRMEKLFEGKMSHLGSGNGKTFKELCKWVEEEFPEKDSEAVLLEATSRMIEEIVDFDEFNYQNYDDVYGFGDGAEWRFDLSDSAAKKLLSGEILNYYEAQNHIWEKAKKEFAELKNNPQYKDEIEITDRINSAFRIADYLYPEFTKEIDKEKNLLPDEWPQYSKEEKKNVINNAFEHLDAAFKENEVILDIYDEDRLIIVDKTIPLKHFETLIKGHDAVNFGKKSLSFVRPNAEQLHDGIENSWKFDEITTGYAIFQNPDLDVKGGFTPKFISKLDDMNVFESDGDAAKQYGIDHNCRILEEKKDIWIGDEDLEYYSYPDIPENRRIMKENGWLLEQPLDQPEEVKAALIESGIAREELYNKDESMPISEEARNSMLSASYAGQGGLTLKAFADNGLEIDLATANALENCFSQIEAMTKYTADGHDLFHSGNGVDSISEHSIEYSETDKAWFVHEKNWLALSAVKGSDAGPEDYMEKADRVGDRNWAISCEELVKYVYQEVKEDGEMEKEFPDTVKKLEKLNEYLESLSEAKQLISDFCFEEYMSTPTFDDPKDVGLAYTTFEDPYTHEEYEVQTSVDLVNNKMTTKVNDKIAETSEYGSLKELIDDSLKSLDFDSLIYVPATKIDELLKEERENIEKNLLEKADQIVSETFDKPSLAKRAKLYVPSDYGYDPDNKIHILVEFDNNAEREDDLFNALAEKHLVLPNGREVDFNPIKPEKSGTIEQYFESLNRIKENRFQRRKEDYLANIKVSTENFRDVFDEVIKLPKFKDKPLEAASWCFSRVPKESRPEVAQWFSNLGCKTRKDTDKLFSKWNKESNPKPNVIKSKNNDKDEWSISD